MTLSCSSLKRWLHREELGRRDRLLVVLASFDLPCQVKEIRARAYGAGLRIPNSWNISDVLRRSRGLAIKVPDGWELTPAGRDHLRTLGVFGVSPAAAEIAADLRGALARIADADTRAFVEEAVKAHEYGLYRSAIVMSWIGAVSVLHKLIEEKHLIRFNAEAKRVNARWKAASTAHDLTRMREAEVLDRMAALSIIGRDVKKALKECLERRNSCGHPNSLEIRANAAAHHLETLLLNVFTKFP